jgi:methyl-accepting chemotaxis protein
MRRVKFRIGAKLAITSGAGIVLVAAMLGNQILLNRSQAQRDEIRKNVDHIQESVNNVDMTIRRLVTANRDIRLANDEKALGAVTERLDQLVEAGGNGIENALQRLSDPANKDRMSRAQSVFTSYADAVSEIAGGQRTIIGAQKELGKFAEEWSKLYRTVTESPAIQNAPNKGQMLLALLEADNWFKDSRAAMWAYFTRGEAAMLSRTRRSLNNTNDALDVARVRTTDQALVEQIDQLVTFAPRYREVMDKALKAYEGQMSTLRERADPARVALDELLEETSAAVAEQVRQLESEAAEAAARAEMIGLIVALAVMAVLVGTAVFGMLTIARPIRRIGEVLMALASGDKTVDIPYVGRSDEVGDNARAAQTFKDNLLRMEQLEAEQKAAEERAAAQRKAELHQMATDFETAVGGIVEAVASATTQLEAAAGTLTQTAETTQELSTNVASASEEASANVQTVAAASEELASSVNEISRQVLESSRIAREAVSQAERTDQRITELSQAAARIGDVIKLITSIAEQTNLLALNATIEAARAGEAGRGFAVVAQEVKALAAQTAKATDEISSQIAGMQQATEDSVAAIKEIGTTIDRISEIAGSIASAVEEQGASTQEIARNVQQAAQGTTEVNSNISQVNRGAAETGTAATQVLASARSLSGESNRLKTEVERFLATVRAA